ncbi:MAG: ComEC/Rec2 family competence protein, partial [Mariprofundus sp.]
MNATDSKRLKLQRLPLLVPVVSGMLGLALTRTDIVGIDVALFLAPVFTIALLLFRQRLPALMLILGLTLGIADLLGDASRASVDESWTRGDIIISAQIERVERLPSYNRYLLDHISREDGQRLSGKALLYHHTRQGKQPQNQSLQAGQIIQTRVRWREPRNYQNPGFFDYRAWCFDRHISLIGSLKGKPEITDAAVSWLELARQRVRNAIASASAVDAGVLQAVLLGDRSQITAAANTAFSATGTAHLLAISGMHVGMAAAWVFMLVWFVLTRREAWIVRFPVRNIALLCGFLGAAVYAAVAGWPLPAVRAVLMLGAAALAWCLASRAEPLNTLLAALGVILLFDASAIASLSLWLSFIATAALLIWAGKPAQDENPSIGQRLGTAVKALLWISLLAALATLPLIISTFGRIPVYSLPANLVMVPLYALIVMPAGLLAEVLAL